MKKLLSLLIVIWMLPCIALAEYSPLASGSSGDSVRQLQQRLNELGISAGTADGIYGRKTVTAVREAQRLLQEFGYAVEQTGHADAETLALIFDPDAEYALLTLSKGSKGDRVRALQSRLIDLNLLKGSADGDFGSDTEAAVLAFQQKMASLGITTLPQDGIAAPKTLQLMMEDLSQYGFRAPVFFDDAYPLLLTAEDLYSNACILMDAPTGKVLFEHNADARLYPASTTKIMTLLLALEEGNLDREITIPESAANVPADSSLVPVSPGEKMTMQDLLHGLMIQSGNDAANAAAELTAGSVDKFVQRMNKRAQELGMTNTHFVNPHGYHDEEHYSSARDLAVLTRLGLTDTDFCRIVTCMQYTMAPTSKRDALLLQNKNDIFNPATVYYIPGAAGVKSGFTSMAGFCYAGACQRNGETLIAIIMGLPSRDRGWQDLRRLFEYGFAL